MRCACCGEWVELFRGTAEEERAHFKELALQALHRYRQSISGPDPVLDEHAGLVIREFEDLDMLFREWDQ